MSNDVKEIEGQISFFKEHAYQAGITLTRHKKAEHEQRKELETFVDQCKEKMQDVRRIRAE